MGDKLTKVLAARKAGGRHSPLYIWMRENHAALSAEFAENGPQWATRVPAMAEVGLVDAAGQAPSIRTAMQTWYRVCRAVGAPSPKREPKPPSAETLPVPTKAAVDDEEEEITMTMGGGKVVTVKIPKS
jgi:hypothetical protein